MKRLVPGYVVGERFELVRVVGSGGMGQVWEATDNVLKRQVALKIMHPHSVAEQEVARRFENEARMAAALSHVTIAAVYDFGEDDGLAYLVEELVPGHTVAELLRQESPRHPDEVRAVISQAAIALGVAHDRRIVHRDVKPANIMLTPDGIVKLMDFGIARSLDAAGQTMSGESLGTPQYISPEQALGKRATGASDLYSLGIIAHEMLTGSKAFDRGTPIATALAQVKDPPPPLPDDIDPDIREIAEALGATEISLAGTATGLAADVYDAYPTQSGSLYGTTPSTAATAVRPVSARSPRSAASARSAVSARSAASAPTISSATSAASATSSATADSAPTPMPGTVSAVEGIANALSPTPRPRRAIEEPPAPAGKALGLGWVVLIGVLCLLAGIALTCFFLH